MSSVGVNVHISGREGEKTRQWGPKMRQLTLSMGTAKVELYSFLERATIPSKRVSFYI
jgi:hypothetical protein